MTKALRRTLAAISAVPLVLLVSACGGSAESEEEAGGSGGTTSIGYLVNFGAAAWYQNVIQGAEDQCELSGCELHWADANVELSKQVTQAEDMLTRGVDVLAISPVDPGGLSSVVADASSRDVPIVTETNAVEGTQTTVGISNLDAAQLLGEYAGEYITSELGDTGRVLIIGLPTQQDTQDRTAGFIAGLEASGADFEVVQEVNGSGLRDNSLQQATDALTANRDINVVFGINEDSTLGGIQAYRETGQDMSGFAAFGFVEGDPSKEALVEGDAFKAGLGMFPEYVGMTLINQALRALDGEELPERTVTPTVVLTPDNLDEYYSKDGDQWSLDYEAVEALTE